MPLEHFLIDYCSVRRLIKDSACMMNKEFNIICQFCEEPMTKQPIALNCLEQYSTQIIQAHFTDRESHLLTSIHQMQWKPSDLRGFDKSM